MSAFANLETFATLFIVLIGLSELGHDASPVYIATEHGVAGDGVSDDSVSIRKLMRSNRTVVFPGNHQYNLCATVGSGYPASDVALVDIRSVENLHVIANGATFSVCPSVGLAQTFLIDRSTRWSWEGGIVVGNRSHLSAEQENVGFGLFNNREFRIKGVRFAGFGGAGAAIAGDYNVDGDFQSIEMEGVGIGYDFAFAKNIRIDGNRATGGGSDLINTKEAIGQKFFSNIFDLPFAPRLRLLKSADANQSAVTFIVEPSSTLLKAGVSYPVYGDGVSSGATLIPLVTGSGTNYGMISSVLRKNLRSGSTLSLRLNFTGKDIEDTENVAITNSEFSNFASGIALSSGKKYFFGNNKANNNPGYRMAKGIGYYVYYNPDGLAPSVGHPVSKVLIEGGEISNNGSSVPGAGLLVEASRVQNEELIEFITVRHVKFYNNVGFGVRLDGKAITNVCLVDNDFEGGRQVALSATQVMAALSCKESRAGSALFDSGRDSGLM